MKSCQAHGRTTLATSPRRKTRRLLFPMLQASRAAGEGSELALGRASASDGACSLLECCLASTSPLTSHPTTKSQSDYTPAVSGFLGLVFFVAIPTLIVLFCLSSSDWVFLAFLFQHIPNFSFSSSSCFLLFAERQAGGKQNRQTGISGSGFGFGFRSTG